MDVEDEEVPLSVNAINLTPSDQSVFEIVADKDVTAENPGKYIAISLLIDDISKRDSKSPFYELRDDISAIEEENLLICYDPTSKFGKNYFLCMSEAAKNWALSKMSEKSEVKLITEEEPPTPPPPPPPTPTPKESDTKTEAEEPVEEGERGEEEEEVEEEIVYKPPEPKIWESRGSEIEIDEEVDKETRPRVTFIFQKELRFYDPNKPVRLGIRRIEDYKMGYVECTPYEDENFELRRMEMEKFVQCANPMINLEVETTYRFPTNCWTQTEPRVLDGKELEEEAKSPKLVQFLKNVLQRMLIVLQQNELFDVYYDEWNDVGKVDPSLHGKESSQIKEYQSFSDLKYSKDKMVTCVEWHPTISGIIIVSCVTRITFDTRIDKMSKLLMNKYYVLVWSIKDPIHPLLLLQATDDVQCISVNPSIPYLVAGGCINGQIVMWDLSDNMETLRQQKPPTTATQNDNDVKFVETIQVAGIRWVAASAFDYTHKVSVETIHWLPDHFEVDPKGYALVSKTGFCCQIMSCGLDSVVSIWDIRPDKQPAMDAKTKSREREIAVQVPQTFQFLDSVWRPVYSYEIPGLAKPEKLLAIRLSLPETHNYRTTTQAFDLQAVNEIPTGEEIAKVKTTLYAGTIVSCIGVSGTEEGFQTNAFFQDGKIGTIQFINEKDVKDADGKIPYRPTTFLNAIHGGPVVSVDRSPFFRNIILTVGMWRFAIWKEEQVGEPLLRLRSPSKRLSSGKWSQVRPSVFFIGKEDGTLDVWDLQEQSHEPVINHTVSAAPLSNINVHPRPQNVKDFMLAAADNLGTLHLLILPPYLLNATSDEMSSLQAFFDSEVECWKYRRERKEYHRERREKSLTKPAVSATVTTEGTRIFGRSETKVVDPDEAMYVTFKQYLELETKFLAQMGVKSKSELKE